MYEIFLYTHGNREYANLMARVIDPEKKYVHERRLITRDDCGGTVTNKSMRRLFPSDHRPMLVVDDRDDVWKEDKGRLYRVRGFT